MSHEKSISVKLGPKKFANLKTVFGGKQLSQRQVVKMHGEGRLRPLGGKTFPTMGAAVDAAKKRSRATKR